MPASIVTYEFKSGLPLEFEILSMQEMFRKNKSMLTRVHRTDFYHILWFTKGSPTHMVDFAQVKMCPQSILFLKKDAVHQFDIHTPFEGHAILFTENFFCSNQEDFNYLQSGSMLFNDLFGLSRIALEDDLATFKTIFVGMQQELSHIKDDYQEPLLRTLLRQFMYLAERNKKKQRVVTFRKDANFDYVLKFKNFIDEQFVLHKQVSYYAKLCNLSEKRLNTATTAILGKAPKVLISDRVMLEAKRLLAHSNSSVKETGFLLGFEEPTNFIKYFKKHTGITPAEFRTKTKTA
jgi:AraC family transcriptional regulator, transcriptional activator of pobA